MNNSSEAARKTIMGMRMTSTGFGTDVEGAFKRAPK